MHTPTFQKTILSGNKIDVISLTNLTLLLMKEAVDLANELPTKKRWIIKVNLNKNVNILA